MHEKCTAGCNHKMKMLLQTLCSTDFYRFEFSILPIHEAWEAVIRRVSFGFSSWFKPINDGITIEGNPSNRPLFSETKLFARAANVWNIEPLAITSILNIRFAVHLTYLRQVATIFSNFFMFILRFFVVFVTVQYTWVCIVHFLSNKMNIFQK